jgi:hypothetical protein
MARDARELAYASKGCEAGGDRTDGIRGRDQGQCGGVRVRGGSVGPVAAQDIAAGGREAVAGDPGGRTDEATALAPFSPAPPVPSTEFDWNPNGDDSENIVVRHQPAIAIYTNPHGDVVIRQAATTAPTRDQFVYVSTENALKVAEKLLAMAGIEVSIHELTAELLLLPAPSKTAERARRYRRRKRDGVTPRRDANVTPISEEMELA